MRSTYFALVLGFASATSAYSKEAPKVVASIKPVHSLVAAVMKGVSVPALLVEGHVSPHTYTMKPSDARVLEGADLVVRIGPEMEIFLAKPLRSISAGKTILDLADTNGLTILEFREEGLLESDHHDDHDEIDHDDDHDEDDRDHAHDHAQFDMHLWLDPENAKLMVGRIAGHLQKINPENADQYQQNASRMLARLDTLIFDIESKLKPVSRAGFLVFHDAYQYFEHRFGLQAAASITLNPQNPAGAATIAEIEQAVAENRIECAFTEPQFSPKLIESIAGVSIRVGTLDPIGAAIEAGPDHYDTLMRQMAATFRKCLDN